MMHVTHYNFVRMHKTLREPLAMASGLRRALLYEVAGKSISVKLRHSPALLSIGLQRPFQENTLFRIGHAYQLRTSWHEARPPLE